MLKTTKLLFWTLFLILSIVSCGETSKKPTGKAIGSEGGDCYGNGSCDDGLICENDICVKSENQTDTDTGNTTSDADTGDIGNTGNTGNTGDIDTNNDIDTEKTDEDEVIPETCGNGKPDEGEECDDGNEWGGDGCTPECKINICGDGYKFEGVEECDDESNNGSYGFCKADCSGLGPYCGDGIIENEIEECDDSNKDDTDKCTNKCLINTDLIRTQCSGQTFCYNDTAIMNCPAQEENYYGQDAQYTKYCKPRSYTVSGTAESDIVTDNNTGLIWQKTIPTTYSGCTGGDPTGSMCQWQEAINYCNGLTYAGQTDWRLPTKRDLSTLIDYGRFKPAIDSTISTNKNLGFFWSSLSFAYDENYAWSENFSNGDDDYYIVTYFSKSMAHYVRCVRGEEWNPENNFIESTVLGNNIVTDSKTGFIWTTISTIVTESWKDSLNYCETLDYAGYADWKLPNIEEIKTLIDYTKNGPASSFPGMPVSDFWSSTTVVSGLNKAWSISFASGLVSGKLDKTESHYFLCVR
ncbi:MAG TPA: DUF1566 domain-containing protein [bacterium]|nr:DUF1566 domain-containing protein [bacterium]